MVRRSSTTSRGTTYWFHCFCFPMSQLPGLRMRNFSDLTCLPKSREEKVIESNEGKDKLDPRSQPTRLSTWQWVEADNSSLLKERSVFALFIYLFLLIN